MCDDLCFDCCEENGAPGEYNGLKKLAGKSLQCEVWCEGCGERIWINDKGIRQDNRYTLFFSYKNDDPVIHESVWGNTEQEMRDFGDAMVEAGNWSCYRVATREDYDEYRDFWDRVAQKIREQAELPETDLERQMRILHCQCGKTTLEIAEELELPESDVREHLEENGYL